MGMGQPGLQRTQRFFARGFTNRTYSSTLLAIAGLGLACSGGGSGGGSGGVDSPVDRFAAVTILENSFLDRGLELIFDGAEIAARAGDCSMVIPAGEVYLASLDPSALSAALISVDSGESLALSNTDGNWIAYTKSTCGGGVRPTIAHFVDSTQTIGSATNPREWPSGAQVDTFSSATANGWAMWSGVHAGLGPRLMLVNLDVSPLPPPIVVATVDLGTEGFLSDDGLLYFDASGATVYWVAAPFSPVVLAPIASTGAAVVDEMGLEGPSGYWREDGALVVFDALRPLSAGVNPRNLGLATQIGISGSQIVWVDAGQIYTLDIADPMSIPQWISDPGFFHRSPRIDAGRIVWKRCAPGMPPVGCANSPATYDLQYFDVATPYAVGVNPVSLKQGISDEFLADIGSIGVTWSEAGARDSVYYYNDLAPTTTFVNPVKVNETFEEISSLLIMDEGIVWRGSATSASGRIELLRKSVLIAETTP